MPTWEKCASVLLVAAGPALAQAACPAEEATGVYLGKQSFQVETAADEAARARGLSGRALLPDHAGMWFVLDQPGRPGFWMHGMTFPIDIVWVSPAGQVVGADHLRPCQADPCPVTFPQAEVRYILEVAAGRFQGQAGDKVSWTCKRARR